MTFAWRFGMIGLLTMPLVAQQQDVPGLQRRDPNTVTLQVNARAVVLDVVVTDSQGHAVKGLKASDLMVTEDGVPQTINSFHEHNALGPAEVAKLSPPKLPVNAFSNFAPAGNGDASTVILIDALDSPIQAQMYLREQVIDYMKTVPAGTTIAVFEMDTEMHLVQGFSSDPAVLLKAVESKRNMPSVAVLMQRNEAYARLRQDYLTAGIEMMGRYLAQFPGRKNLVWFTGSIPRSVYGGGVRGAFADDNGFDERMNQAANVLALSQVAVYPVDDRGLEGNHYFDASRRGPPPLNSSPPTHIYDHEQLDEVAESTGGKAYYNTNGLKQVLGQIAESGSNYYSIAYSPTNGNWNGGYRSIKIALAAPVKGTTLLYRHGYNAMPERAAKRVPQTSVTLVGATDPTVHTAEPQSAGAPQSAMVTRKPGEPFEASMQLGAIQPTELVFGVSVAPGTEVHRLDKKQPLPENNFMQPAWQGKPFRTYQMLFAVDMKKVRFVQQNGKLHGHLDFVVVVYTDKGEEVNSFNAATDLNFDPDTYRHVMQVGLGIKQAVAVPEKGNYFFRIGVHDTQADRVGAMELPVDNVVLGVAGPGQALVP